MTPARIGSIIRMLRHRQNLTQAELGARAGVSRGPIQRIEGGRLEAIATGTVARVAEALGARLELGISWHGAALDRVLDEGHARLAAIVLARLARLGWTAQVEVSFAHYGDRGSIDILGWDAETATLLVVEIKTELGSVEGLLRPLDIKVRVAPAVAAERFGWRAARVARLVVFPGEPTVRRQVGRHAGVLDVALPARSRVVGAWLRQPAGTLRGIWFVSSARSACIPANPSARRRVRSSSAPVDERGRRAPIGTSATDTAAEPT